ncbi:hypothetical protein [Rhizobium leguminosarum]
MAILFAASGLSTARAECSTLLTKEDSMWFLNETAGALQALKLSTLDQVLAPIKAEAPASPESWLDTQLCPFDTQLEGNTADLLGSQLDLARWRTVANALFQLQLFQKEPQFPKLASQALDQFDTLAGGSETSRQARELIDAVSNNVSRNRASITQDELNALFPIN